MSNDKKQKEEDKHKKLKQYAKENAEIAGIAGAGVLAGKKLVLKPAWKAVNKAMGEDNFRRDPEAIKKIHKAYKAQEIGENVHLLTDPETGKKVVSFKTDVPGHKYNMHENSANTLVNEFKGRSPEDIAYHHFRLASGGRETDEQYKKLRDTLKDPEVNRKLQKIYDDKNFSGAIHHTGEAGTMLHEFTHASRSGLASKFMSNIHAPSAFDMEAGSNINFKNVLKNPGSVATRAAPTATFLATAKKRKDESEKDYQKRMGRNIGLATLGATALSAPGQVIEEGRANLGAIRRAKAIGLKLNKRPLAGSWGSYWLNTAGVPLASGAGTYAAMKLWRRNKLKEEQNKAKLEKKSSLSDEQIIAGTETSKRELNHALMGMGLGAIATIPVGAITARKVGVDYQDLMHEIYKPENAKKKKAYIAATTAALLGGTALPYVLRKKNMKEYYNEQLEHAKKSKK